jgi:hypothetical protein
LRRVAAGGGQGARRLQQGNPLGESAFDPIPGGVVVAGAATTPQQKPDSMPAAFATLQPCVLTSSATMLHAKSARSKNQTTQMVTPYRKP